MVDLSLRSEFKYMIKSSSIQQLQFALLMTYLQIIFVLLIRKIKRDLFSAFYPKILTWYQSYGREETQEELLSPRRSYVGYLSCRSEVSGKEYKLLS
jgi:hypothetical protein